MHIQLPKQIEKTKNYLVIVEGKKDKIALEKLGFNKIFVFNETGQSLGERIEKIQELCSKKDKICILTDFDKKGKKLYLLIKSKLSEIGVKLDSSLRAFLLREKISHIEGLAHFIEYNENKKTRRARNNN